MKVYLGLDIGFGETKAIFLDSNFETINFFSFPTLVAFYNPSPLEKEKVVILSGNRKYVIGRDARGEAGCFQPVDFEDIKEFSPLFLKGVLSMNGLELDHLIVADNQEIVVCASIPPGWWPEREELGKSLREEVKNVLVVPQGQGAFVVVNEEESFEEGEMILVLDFGYNTVDYLLIEIIEEDFQINKGNTLSGMGIMKLVNFFKSKLHGEVSRLSDRALREALRKGEVKVFGERIDLGGQKRRAVEEYCTMLMRELKKMVGDIWREVDAVICTGGGVYYFDPVDNLPHHRVIVPERPEFANAEGQARWIAKNIEESQD